MKKRGKDRLCIVILAVLALAFTLAGCELPGGGGSGSYVQYTVTFNTNGGMVTPATKKVTADEAMEILPTPTKTGGDTVFRGWFTGNGNSGGEWGNEFLASTLVTADIAVYAKWGSGSEAGTAINITIGFEYGALTLTGSDGVNLLPKTQAGQHPASLTLSAAGYTGIKWYINGAGTSNTTGTLTINASDYVSQIHSIAFTGWKNSVFYSSEPIAFTGIE
jgi:hypothetical protein